MPPAITLPQLSNEVVTHLSIPSQPNVPPSSEDIVRALVLKNDVILLRTMNKATDADVLKTVDYEATLLSSREASAPSWFASAMDQALQPLKDDIKSIKTDIKDIKTEIKGIQTEVKLIKNNLEKFSRTVALTSNRLQPPGPTCVLEAVPNRDSAPTPTDLPALVSHQAIQELSNDHQIKWLRYYSPDDRVHALQRLTVEERTERLMTEVGARFL